MRKQCLYNNSRYCDIWTDYQIALASLEEAEELSHQNWIEIQYLHNRIYQLEAFIRLNGLSLPEGPD